MNYKNTINEIKVNFRDLKNIEDLQWITNYSKAKLDIDTDKFTKIFMTEIQSLNKNLDFKDKSMIADCLYEMKSDELKNSLRNEELFIENKTSLLSDLDSNQYSDSVYKNFLLKNLKVADFSKKSQSNLNKNDEKFINNTMSLVKNFVTDSDKIESNSLMFICSINNASNFDEELLERTLFKTDKEVIKEALTASNENQFELFFNQIKTVVENNSELAKGLELDSSEIESFEKEIIENRNNLNDKNKEETINELFNDENNKYSVSDNLKNKDENDFISNLTNHLDHNKNKNKFDFDVLLKIGVDKFKHFLSSTSESVKDYCEYNKKLSVERLELRNQIDKQVEEYLKESMLRVKKTGIYNQANRKVINKNLFGYSTNSRDSKIITASYYQFVKENKNSNMYITFSDDKNDEALNVELAQVHLAKMVTDGLIDADRVKLPRKYRKYFLLGIEENQNKYGISKNAENKEDYEDEVTNSVSKNEPEKNNEEENENKEKVKSEETNKNKIPEFETPVFTDTDIDANKNENNEVEKIEEENSKELLKKLNEEDGFDLNKDEFTFDEEENKDTNSLICSDIDDILKEDIEKLLSENECSEIKNDDLQKILKNNNNKRGMSI